MYKLENNRFIIERLFLLLFLILAHFLFISQTKLFGGIINYKPEVDISSGSYSFFFSQNEKLNGQPAPTLDTGVYAGGYLNLQSPLFSFFFDTEKIHSIYEAGFALNRINGSSAFALSIPVSANLGYMINFTPRFGLIPFLGTGFAFIHLGDEYSFFPVHYFLCTGLEIKYRLWERTFLKLKADVGVIFASEISTGYAYFFKLRFPFPFIP